MYLTIYGEIQTGINGGNSMHLTGLKGNCIL